MTAHCPNCGNEQTKVLLIDCSLPFGETRDRLRYCFSCRPEAHHPYAGCFPRVIMASGLCEKEKRAALAARRYVGTGANRILWPRELSISPVPSTRG